MGAGQQFGGRQGDGRQGGIPQRGGLPDRGYTTGGGGGFRKAVPGETRPGMMGGPPMDDNLSQRDGDNKIFQPPNYVQGLDMAEYRRRDAIGLGSSIEKQTRHWVHVDHDRRSKYA